MSLMGMPHEHATLLPCIERNRSRIVTVALNRSLPPERHTILADALANRTFDYMLAALKQSDEGALIAWVTSTLNGFVREQGLFDIFAAVASASLDVLLDDVGFAATQLARSIEHIQRCIDLAVGASRLESEEERFSLDSVDAKINEVLYKLSERDTITAEHSRSVGLWCWRIAKRMGLTREESLLASRSGQIHDIGKISTPLEILTAPRSLSESEWEIMRLHTLEGVKALDPLPELQEMVPAVRWHHERMDGRGYPDALDGTRIPLCARIVAVADAFNAMVARRPYRKPLSPTVALEELKRNSGTHFDPPIVAAMIEVVSQ